MVGLMPVIQISGPARVANDNQVYVSWWAVPLLWVFGILAIVNIPPPKGGGLLEQDMSQPTVLTLQGSFRAPLTMEMLYA